MFKLKPLKSLYIAQFLSAFADNMVLFIILAIITDKNLPDFYPGLSQAFFLLAYILLAPFVGAFADKHAKSNVLFFGNVIKAIGVATLVTGFNPVISYTIVGIGAAIYGPAKYGLLPELTRNSTELHHANAKMEGFTILAILAGGVAGGIIANLNILIACTICVIVYVFSILGTLIIPKERPFKNYTSYAFEFKNFFSDVKKLFLIKKSHFSLVGTSSFWMSSSVIRLAFLAWIPIALAMKPSTVTILVAITGVGIVVGSLVTPKIISIKKYYNAYVFGFLMAITICLSVLIGNAIIMGIMLFLIGFMGGVYIVPMNTALQEVGQNASVGAGKTIAVQNFVNNSFMIVSTGLYTLFTSIKVPVTYSIVGIGCLLFIVAAYLAIRSRDLK